MQGTKFEDGCGSPANAAYSDVDTSSCEVSGGGGCIRRDASLSRRGHRFRPGREQTHRERMAPTGLRGGEGVCQRGRMCASNRKHVPSLILRGFFHGKNDDHRCNRSCWLLCSTCCIAVSPRSEMCFYGWPGNEQYLDGLAHDMMGSFAARGTIARVTFGTNP